MNNRKYERFIPQEDNVKDVIQAEDINELQRAIQHLQELSFREGDEAFLARALMALEHHPDANAMIVEQFKNEARINLSRFTEMMYDDVSHSIVMDGEGVGKAVIEHLVNPTGQSFQSIVLLADEYKPQGCQIYYEYSYDDQTYYAIQANQALGAASTNDERNQLYIRITMTKDADAPNPRVDALAILYQDMSYKLRFLDDGTTVEIDSPWDGTIVK